MPTISQLPIATVVFASDEVPISQNGSACAVSVGNLLSSTQPAISINSPSLLGRTSLGAGGPEEIDCGLGIAVSAGTIAANGADHASYPSASGLLIGSDLVISNHGSQMLMATGMLRDLFSAGENVAINPNGVISAIGTGTLVAGTISGSSIAALQVVPAISAADIVAISQSGTDHGITYANLLNGLTTTRPRQLPRSQAPT